MRLGLIAAATGALMLSTTAVWATHDVRCIQGSVQANSAYQELVLSYDGPLLAEVSFRNEIGPSLSGNYFGCSLHVSRQRPGRGDSWSIKDGLAKIGVASSTSPDQMAAEVAVEDAGEQIVATFNVSEAMEFCGVQAGIPERIRIDKKTGRCLFDGPQL
jgi:hypothetical protein